MIAQNMARHTINTIFFSNYFDLDMAVTEFKTASSFLQLLTNALHDQHQIYNFISQNKTIMAAPVRNGFLNSNTNFKMFQYVRQLQTYQRCWADEQRKVYQILYLK